MPTCSQFWTSNLPTCTSWENAIPTSPNRRRFSDTGRDERLDGGNQPAASGRPLCHRGPERGARPVEAGRDRLGHDHHLRHRGHHSVTIHVKKPTIDRFFIQVPGKLWEDGEPA